MREAPGTDAAASAVTTYVRVRTCVSVCVCVRACVRLSFSLSPSLPLSLSLPPLSLRLPSVFWASFRSERAAFVCAARWRTGVTCKLAQDLGVSALLDVGKAHLRSSHRVRLSPPQTAPGSTVPVRARTAGALPPRAASLLLLASTCARQCHRPCKVSLDGAQPRRPRTPFLASGEPTRSERSPVEAEGREEGCASSSSPARLSGADLLACASACFVPPPRPPASPLIIRHHITALSTDKILSAS